MQGLRAKVQMSWTLQKGSRRAEPRTDSQSGQITSPRHRKLTKRLLIETKKHRINTLFLIGMASNLETKYVQLRLLAIGYGLMLLP